MDRVPLNALVVCTAMLANKPVDTVISYSEGRRVWRVRRLANGYEFLSSTGRRTPSADTATPST